MAGGYDSLSWFKERAKKPKAVIDLSAIAEMKGIRKAAVAITSAEGTRLEHYWEDGPQLAGWGEVIAKYPDGAPAIVQGAVGSGWVVLTGVHPEAPERWRYGMSFTTPASDDNKYAARLIRAALERKPLPHF